MRRKNYVDPFKNDFEDSFVRKLPKIDEDNNKSYLKSLVEHAPDW